MENRELPVFQEGWLHEINRPRPCCKYVQLSSEGVVIKHRIDEIYTKPPFYNPCRGDEELKDEEVNINR